VGVSSLSRIAIGIKGVIGEWLRGEVELRDRVSPKDLGNGDAYA
jgi:hypothetical protein